MRIARPLVLVALAVAAAPAFAYTIYLKSGARLVAQEKFTVEGELAILIQPSGTVSSIALAEIDIERTDAANVGNLSSTAMVLEGGTVDDFKSIKKPPPVRVRIQDLINEDQAGLRQDRIGARSAPLLPAAANRANTPATRGGAAKGAARQPLADRALALEILTFVTARGVSAVEIFSGASSKTPLLVYGTSSEGAVFKAIVTGANALLHFQSQKPGSFDAFEIVCEGADGSPGGHFLLSPQQAAQIISGQAEITQFYVDNVLF